MYKLFKRFLLSVTFVGKRRKYLECIKLWKPPVMADNKGSLINVSIDGEGDKKKQLSVVHKLPGATKNESIYFRLFTLYFGCKGKENKEKKKKNPIQEVLEPRPQLLFHGPRFFKRFKNSHAKRPGSRAPTRRRGREKRRSEETKPNKKTVTSAAASSQTVWCE